MNTVINNLMNNKSVFELLLFFVSGILIARFSTPLIHKYFRYTKKFFSREVHEKILSSSKLPFTLMIMCGIWYMGLHFNPLKPEWRVFFIQPIRILISYSLIILLYQFLDIFEIYITKPIKKEQDSLRRQIIPYCKKILKVFIAIMAALIVLQNAGFNVTAILAGLGLGGVAVALGAKETLSNIFGGFSIIVDRPFSVGDWIVCNNIEGTVMDIGFRSTQLKTFYDSVITVPNSVIADSVVDNLGKRTARRTRFTLGLVYDTSPEEIEAFVEGVKNIILANSCTRKDYYQAYFSGYQDSSLQIFVNFFLKVSSWDEELLQKQNIYLEILRLGRELNVSFAFPTQTVEVSQLPNVERTVKDIFSTKDLKSKAESFGPDGKSARSQGLGVFTPPFKETPTEE